MRKDSIPNLSSLLVEGPAELLGRPIAIYAALLCKAEALQPEHLEAVDYALRHTVERLLAGAAQMEEVQATSTALRTLVLDSRKPELRAWLPRWRGFADLLDARLTALEAQNPAEVRHLVGSQEGTADVTRERKSPFLLESPPEPRLGTSFEKRVRRLLELHGYTVGPEQILSASKVDLVARKTYGLAKECWWVECKDHKRPVPKGVLEKLEGWVRGREGVQHGARGMVVARAFSSSAVAYAENSLYLAIWQVDDLERLLFDPRLYLHTLITGFEQSPLAHTYVDQLVLLENQPQEEARVNLLEHALTWAAGEGARLWLLLGDYGTGKSAFFQRFAAELARRALADPEAPFPVAVDLKEFPNATSAETLLFEHLRRRAPSFRGDPGALLHLLSAGRCILLLDAFDEMGVAAAGRRVEEQFRELARLAGEEPLNSQRGNRLLVTCRTHFFRDQQQVKDTASGRIAGLRVDEDSTLGRLARRFNAEIDELCLFSEEQIAEFLQKHLGSADATRAQKFIKETYDLDTLAPRPVLLEMIVKSLPTLWKEGATEVTSAGLYEIYTRQWLEDRGSRNLVTPPILRHRLLTVLAASLWRRDDRQIHHSDLLAEVQRLSTFFPALDYERVDMELRTAAFLVRSAEGYYRFSHKSFLEFFLARDLWEKLGGDADAVMALDLPPLTSEIGEFFWQLSYDGRAERLGTLESLLKAPYRLGVSENALRLSAWSQRHGGEVFVVEEAQLTGANLAGENFGGIRLPWADLTGAQLEGAVLEDVILTEARLGGAKINHARAARADFTGAWLADASLVGADLSRTRLCGAKLDRAALRETVLDGADMAGASLMSADLTKAAGDAPSFMDTNLWQARLEDSVWVRANFRGAHFEETDTTGWLLAEEEGLPLEIPRSRLEGRKAQIDFCKGDWSWVWSVAWSPSGGELAATSDDGSVRVWSGTTGELERTLSGNGSPVYSVAWSPSGHELAVGGVAGSVRIWNQTTGELRRELSGSGAILSMSWSPSGNELATGSADGWVRVWHEGSKLRWQQRAATEARILSVAWSTSGHKLATGDDADSAQIWDGATGELRQKTSGAGHSILAMSWSSRHELASGGADGTVRVWDGDDGKLRQELSNSGDSVLSLAWSPSGRELAAGSTDGSVRIWDRDTGKLQWVLEGIGGPAFSVAWSPCGPDLAVGSEKCSVRVWNGSTGNLKGTFLAWRDLALATIPGGWFVLGSSPQPDPRRLRLLVAPAGAGPDCDFHELPFVNNLARLLESRERVRAALAKVPISSHEFLSTEGPRTARTWNLARYNSHVSSLHALLIGIDGYLPNRPFSPGIEGYEPLRGCVAGISAIEDYLVGEFGIQQIIRLTASNVGMSEAPPEPQQFWPTYENMVAAFERLTREAEPGDQIYIHYNGHGGVVPTCLPEIKGARGYDETLVPVDIGNPQARHLRDVELALLLQRMAERNLFVTLVLDCCQAGGVLRGGDLPPRPDGSIALGVPWPDITARPLQSLVGSHMELQAAWRKGGVSGRRGRDYLSSLRAFDSWIVLAACQPHEQAFSYPAENGTYQSALTYEWLEALRGASPGISYQELYERILPRIQSRPRRQTPILYGTGERFVFGKDRIPRLSTVPVIAVEAEGRGIILDTGVMQGVFQGAHFALYPADCISAAPSNRLALVEVVECGATACRARVIGTEPTQLIAPGSQAMLVNPGSLSLQSFVEVRQGAKHVHLPKEIFDGFKAAILADTTGFIRLATGEEPPDYQVIPREHGVWEILTSWGEPPHFPTVPSVSFEAPEVATTLVRRLVHLTKFRNIDRLHNPDRNSPDIGVEWVGYSSLELPCIRSGETIRLKVANLSPFDLAVHALILRSDGSVQWGLLGAERGHFAMLGARQNSEELGEIRQFEHVARLAAVPGKVTERIKIFASRRQISDFSWLELPPWEGSSLTFSHQRTETSLDPILASLAGENPRRREVVILGQGSRDWTVETLEMQIQPSLAGEEDFGAAGAATTGARVVLR